MLSNKNPIYGKGNFFSVNHKAKISVVNKTENHRMFNRNHSENSKLAISITKSILIFVFFSDGSLTNIFFYNKAAVFKLCFIYCRDLCKK